jgi:hypothetical protein
MSGVVDGREMSHQRLSDDFDDTPDPVSHSYKRNDQVDVFDGNAWGVYRVVNTTEPSRVKVRAFHEPEHAASWVSLEHVAPMWTRADPTTAILDTGMKVFSKQFAGPCHVVAVRKSQVVIIVDDWMRIVMQSDLTQNPSTTNK